MSEVIRYTNIQRFTDLEFGAYKEMKGYSFSYLKREQNSVTPEFKMTNKVLMGSMVDAILTGGEVDMLHELYPIAKKIAKKIDDGFGSSIKRFQKQVSFTAELVFHNIMMRSTGRVDFTLPLIAVLDLKITGERNIDALIARMMYDQQTWHYANLAQVPARYLLFYSTSLKEAFLKDLGPMHAENRWWEDKVIKFGTVVKAA